jgi:hypothetical protein
VTRDRRKQRTGAQISERYARKNLRSFLVEKAGKTGKITVRLFATRGLTFAAGAVSGRNSRSTSREHRRSSIWHVAAELFEPDISFRVGWGTPVASRLSEPPERPVLCTPPSHKGLTRSTFSRSQGFKGSLQPAVKYGRWSYSLRGQSRCRCPALGRPKAMQSKTAIGSLQHMVALMIRKVLLKQV